MAINSENLNKYGALFIHKANDKFHTKIPDKAFILTNNVESNKPAEKIQAFHSALVRSHFPEQPDTERLTKRKEYYYKQHVIKPENCPESFFDLQRQIAREQGHGDIQINDQLKQELINNVINDQKASFDNWFDYFLSEDTSMYPIWAKHWAFNGMLNLGKYDKENQKFSARSKSSTCPFAELDREALAFVMDLITKRINEYDSQVSSLNKEKKTNLFSKVFPEVDNELKNLILGGSFKTLYEYALKKISFNELDLSKTEGKWIKFEEGSDHMPLVKSLEGHGTGWCTAAESTAKTQLQVGDFYVYYSNDTGANPSIPRAAIRMQNDQIAEIRGIAANQNLDSGIEQIVEDKLKEFPEAGSYKKKSSDMKQLTALETKINNNEELKVEELKFLYEVDSSIKGFGYREDPRINEIKSKREIKEDYAKIYGIKTNQLALSIKDLDENTVVVASGLDLAHSQITSLPDALTHIGGYLNLRNSKITSLPDALTHIGGGLDLGHSQITSLPNALTHIGSSLYLRDSKITSLPNALTHIGSNLDLRNSQITSLPDALTNIGGNLDLRNSQITSLPNTLTHIGVDIYLRDSQITSLPDALTHIGGDLDLRDSKITSIPDALTHIGGSIHVLEGQKIS
ncbi:MAG: hypothetical protein HOA17_03190, partial [Candidatus Melainabacteria bacterium]|nr:hypothetical protein [Candidatus Melainabacteria bacterium]